MCIPFAVIVNDASGCMIIFSVFSGIVFSNYSTKIYDFFSRSRPPAEYCGRR